MNHDSLDRRKVLALMGGAILGPAVSDTVSSKSATNGIKCITNNNYKIVKIPGNIVESEQYEEFISSAEHLDRIQVIQNPNWTILKISLDDLSDMEEEIEQSKIEAAGYSRMESEVKSQIRAHEEEIMGEN